MDMYNCLKMPTLRFRKLLASLFVFAAFAMSMQAATYYWTGSGGDGLWTTAANWNTAADGSGTAAGTGGPTSDDHVYITSSAIISIGTENISVDGISLGSNGQSASFAVKITGSTGTLNVGNHEFSENTADKGIVTYRPTAATDTSITSSLELDCNVSATNLAIHSGGNVTISSGKTATIPTVTIMAEPPAETPTNLSVAGKLISSTSITAADFFNQTITNTGIISAGTITGHTGTVANSGFIVTQNNPASGLITGSGTRTTAAAGAYVWTGTTDSKWSIGNNWVGGAAPSAGTETIVIPLVSNLPEIDTSDTVAINTSNLTIASGVKFTVNGTLNLTGDCDITSIIDTSSSGSLSVSGELSNSNTFSASDLAITCGSLNATNDIDCKSLSVTGAASFTSVALNSADNVTFSGPVSSTSLVITATGKDVAFGNTLNSTTVLSVTSANLSFGGAVTVKDITLNTTVNNTAQNITVSGNWTNNGSFSANTGTVTFTTGNADETYADVTGNNTFYNLEIQRNINFYNNTNVTNNFTANRKETDTHMGGRNIMFANGVKLTVGGIMTLKGQNNTSRKRLRLCGINPETQNNIWELHCNTSVANSILYVSFKGCNNTSGGTLILTDCTDMGSNTGYFFPSQTYTWKGTSDNDWTNANNWNTKAVPLPGSKVQISAATKHPILGDDLVLTASYNGTAYNGTITVNTGAIFDITSKSINLGSGGKITNIGTIRLNGSSGQTIIGTMVNSGVDSTIEYYDSTGSAAFNSLVWDGGTATGNQFQNLIISMPVTSTEQLDVAGTTTIVAGASSTVSLNNSSNKFTGNVTIGNSAAATPVSAGVVTLNGTGAVSGGTASPIYLEDSVYADSLTLNSKAGGDSLTFDTDLIINCEAITTSESQTYKGDVTISENTKLTSGGDITFESYSSLTNTAKTFELSAPTSASITFAGTVGDLTPFYSLKISQAKDTTFTQFTDITTFIDTNVSGNIIFEDGGTISTAGGQTFNTSGTVTFGNGDTTDIMSFGSSSPYLALTHINGDTVINGTLNAADIILAKTFVNGTINGEDISTGITNLTNSTITGTSLTTGRFISNGTSTIETIGTQHYSDTFIASDISIQGTTITFDQTAQISSLTIPQATSTVFKGAAAITSLTDYAASGNITFTAGGLINGIDGDTLKTTGTLTIGNTTTTPPANKTLTVYGNINHSAGDTVIYGKLIAVDITLAKLTGGDITITNSGTITLPVTAPVSTITCNKFIQDGTGNVSLGRSITADTGAISFAKQVVITDDATLTANNANGGITFSDNLLSSGSSKLTLVSNEKNINITGTVGSSTSSPFNSLEIQGSPASPATSISALFNDAVYINTFADTSYSGNITFKNSGTISTSGGQTFNTPGTVSFGDAAADIMSFGSSPSYLDLTHTNGDTVINGTLHAKDISLAKTTSTGTSTIETSGTQHYSDTFSAANISIQGTAITFDSTAQAASFTLTQATSTVFTGAVTITSFTDYTASGDIAFTAGGTINGITGGTLNTNGTVTVGAADAATPPTLTVTNNLTHNTQTNIYGTLSTPSKNVTLGPALIRGSITSNDISLGTTTGGPVTLTGRNITLTQNLTSDTSVKITNSGLFKTEDGMDLVFGYTSSATFTQEGSGNSSLGGSFSGNGNATFATDLLLYGNSPATFGTAGNSITIGESTTAGVTSFTKNLIISRGDSCTINADTSAQNIVLYKGDVTINANLNADKDIVILGNNGSAVLYKDASTGLTEEYIYANTDANSRPSAWSQANYTATKLPDGNNVPSSGFNASLTTDTGKTVTAKKNFYANKTSLTGTGTWYLKVPDLTNPNAGFAEAYHSVISDCYVICTDDSTDGSKARLVALECTGNSNTNVDFDDFVISDAYTVRDNAIRINFNRPVRFHADTLSSLKFHDSSNTANKSFTGFFRDPDCTDQLNIGDTFHSEVISGTTYYYCYIKAAPQDSSVIGALGAWNTDATGKSAGAADNKSSDRSGVHHSTKPCLDFPRALSGKPFILTDIWGKRLKNYSSRPSTDATEAAYGSSTSSYDVADKTGPVLWTVRTGQELHDTYDPTTGETSQHSYDAHNFLEFRYSEPVDIDTLTTSSLPVENVQVTDSFGAISENISSAHSTLTFAGLAKVEAPAGSTLQLYTGSSGSANKYVNALYRQDEYSIRLSLAGWTDGTVTDYSGNSYKKWPGYIEAASQFTGAKVKALASVNSTVLDKASPPNSQIEYDAPLLKVEPLIYSNSTSANTSDLLPVSSPAAVADLYSPWDISAPVFTPLRFSSETSWGSDTMSEAIGNTNGSGSTLDRIDFHFFDNTPAYTFTGTDADQAEWFTEIGWCSPGAEASKANLKDSSYTYCADIIGGARQFDPISARRTSGGIRFSTKTGISTAFRYSTNSNNPSPSTGFLPGIANVHTTIVSQLFTGSSTPMRPANDPDGLYLGLGLTDTNLSVETTFSFSYDDSLGYLTDLAGNRLHSKTSKTIDRTPPSFDIILSPVDTKAIYIIFVKQLVTKSSSIRFKDDTGRDKYEIDTNFPEFNILIPRCFRIISIDASGNAVVSTENQIDTAVPAEVVDKFSNDSFTCIKLTTTNEINIENLQNLYIQLITPAEYPQTGTDPLTNNTGSRVTFIQDLLGNYMSMYSAHALSDFAINYVNPLYAYSSDMLDDSVSVMNGLYKENSWAVHDWNADQQNFGTLPAGHPISIVADSRADHKIRVYLSPSPDSDSVSSQLNDDFKTKFRIWLPDLQNGLFRALSAVNNTNFVYSDASAIEGTAAYSIFDITKETSSEWKSGKQISFMFGLMDSGDTPVRIHNNPYYDVSADRFNLSLSIPVPLYCLRMTDTSDLSTLDLWSFKVRGVTKQRGGVTILNNVINASKSEKAVVMVEMPEAGKLNVIVMTLDGNVITYLNRGNAKAGEHYFTWNGKNKNGVPVARGMYFIRVTGNDIDETRKVMVVKD